MFYANFFFRSVNKSTVNYCACFSGIHYFNSLPES